MTCPCGSAHNYDVCCGLFHKGTEIAATAVQLMRSRYSAFVKQEISYLKETTWPANQKHFDEAGYLDRAANSIWLGLTVHDSKAGTQADNRGTVAFTAKSMVNGEVVQQTENSLFRKKNGLWYYVKPIE
ncbi:MAG: YchJ family protein [Rhizobiaceae bacterium]